MDPFIHTLTCFFIHTLNLSFIQVFLHCLFISSLLLSNFCLLDFFYYRSYYFSLSLPSSLFDHPISSCPLLIPSLGGFLIPRTPIHTLRIPLVYLLQEIKSCHSKKIYDINRIKHGTIPTNCTAWESSMTEMYKSHAAVSSLLWIFLLTHIFGNIWGASCDTNLYGGLEWVRNPHRDNNIGYI